MKTHTLTLTDDELDCLVDAMWRHHMEAVHAASRWQSKGQALTGVLKRWRDLSDRLRVRFAEMQREAEEMAAAE